MSALSKLICPRSVAVIGASSDESKTSGRPIAYLKKHGFKGEIYPVNPKVSEINGYRCYPDIASLPQIPDVAIVLLSAERSLQAVAELSRAGTAAAIVLASGYSETGDAGALRQQALLQAAGDMRILGPNTIGLVNVTDNIPLSASGALALDHFDAGHIAVVSQSGGILGALLSRASARGIGLSKLISTSNEVDIELADMIDWLVDDPATRVIALYVETIRDAEKFRQAALKAQRAHKTLVAFKIGRSEAGAQAAVSHTGALAGSDRMYDALFAQLGILRAQYFSDLLDMPMALACGRQLRGKRVAILTSTGGAGTLVSDSLGMAGFECPVPDEITSKRLRDLQTGSEAVLDRNPIDVTLAGLEPNLLKGAIQALLDSPSYDALVIIVGSSGLAQPELMANAIQACLHTSEKPVLAFVSPHAPQVAAVLTQCGVPAFMAPESCSAALQAMQHAHTWGELDIASQTEAASSRIVSSALQTQGLGTGALDEAQAKQLFAAFGIPVVQEHIVCTAEQAHQAVNALGGQVVLKVLSKDITHKSDVGGVAVGLSVDTIEQRLLRMTQEVERLSGIRPTQFLVQQMVNGGTEWILGMHRDALGTAILLGMGGITAELFKDTTMCMLPPSGGLTRSQALQMAQSLKTWPLLNGYRGAEPADVEALIDVVVVFSNMVAELGDRLQEAEINPVFVLPQGKGAVCADGVVVLAI